MQSIIINKSFSLHKFFNLIALKNARVQMDSSLLLRRLLLTSSGRLIVLLLFNNNKEQQRFFFFGHHLLFFAHHFFEKRKKIKKKKKPWWHDLCFFWESNSVGLEQSVWCVRLQLISPDTLRSLSFFFIIFCIFVIFLMNAKEKH